METATKSRTACLPSILGCLKVAEEILGEGRTWEDTNGIQEEFLLRFFTQGISEVGIPELENIASWDANEINAFLAERGFNIALEPLNDGEFGVASVLDVLVKWAQKCLKTVIRVDGNDYPAVSVPKSIVSIRKYARTVDFVAKIETVSGDAVYVAMPSPEVGDGYLDLYNMAIDYMEESKPSTEFSGLTLPMIDLDQEVDIGWIKGMITTDSNGDDWYISQALQQNKLRLNEFGARAESATTMAMTRGIGAPVAPPLIIDRPFLIWFTRPGLDLPLFVGYITEENWKEPSEL